ncbi:unnamed protein product, partial [Ectocarpus fasciculatus]
GERAAALDCPTDLIVLGRKDGNDTKIKLKNRSTTYDTHPSQSQHPLPSRRQHATHTYHLPCSMYVFNPRPLSSTPVCLSALMGLGTLSKKSKSGFSTIRPKNEGRG